MGASGAVTSVHDDVACSWSKVTRYVDTPAWYSVAPVTQLLPRDGSAGPRSASAAPTGAGETVNGEPLPGTSAKDEPAASGTTPRTNASAIHRAPRRRRIPY